MTSKIRVAFILLVSLAAVLAVPKNPQRIVGGSVTTINVYPFGTALLYSSNLASYWQACGGTILNTRSILSAAHCFYGDTANRWRIRVGSTYANSGGSIHNTGQIINHPSYNQWTSDNDVAVLRSATTIVYVNNAVQPANIAGANYNLADNQAVWAIGWAVPKNPQRIVGGSVTTINVYPFGTALLYSSNLASYWQACGGTILNTRSILSAAHCFYGDTANRWRIRVGSTYANSGGSIHNTGQIINHPSYNQWTSDNDVAVLRSATTIVYVNNAVQPANIAGANYNLADNQAVWAIGWGTTYYGGPASEQLRHVQIWTVNQATCRSRYAEIGMTVTDNMLCSGWLDVGGRDQCQGDSGGPLIHNGIIVGVCSWGAGCAQARYPGVNARVSRYTAWIQSYA